MAPAKLRTTAQKTKSKPRPKQRKFSNNAPPGLYYLPLLDPRSEEFVDLFRLFLSSRDERNDILELSEPDARVFIEIIDGAFRAARLDPALRTLAFALLRRLCGRIGHLPDSYLLSDKFDLSGMPPASGGFPDLRMGVFGGKYVAVKSLRVSEMGDETSIRKRFCKEVVLWKNLFHPNVLNPIGVPDTIDGGRFSIVYEWAANGNIVEYARNNTGNHLELLADAAKGLRYLHNANIVHGGLKGANILITNNKPVSARLSDFRFVTFPDLWMESVKHIAGAGTTHFIAPELLVPSKFGLDMCRPSKEADIYAMAMVTYQVLTGKVPFSNISEPQVVFKVLMGERPSKPANAFKLGLSDHVWELLEDCWKIDRTSRPSISDVSARIKAAASVCGVLSAVGDTPQNHEDPDSEASKFDQLFLEMPSAGEELGATPVKRPPGQGSTLTETSLPNSLPSNRFDPSEVGSNIVEPPQASPDPISQSSVPGSEAAVRSRPLRNTSSPHQNKIFSESSGGSRTIFSDAVPTQREQPQSDTDAAAIAVAQARDDPTRQPCRPSSTLLVGNFGPLPTEADFPP